MRALILFSVMLVLAGCGERGHIYRQQAYTFGTLVDITIWGHDEAKAQQAMAAVFADLDRMHHDWHAWEPGPLLELNQALPSGEWVQIPEPLKPLLRRAQVLSETTGGLFNPGIGELIRLWGFNDQFYNRTEPPPQAEIDAILARHASIADLEIEADRVRSRNPAVYLDLGGFAKGLGVDLAIARLKERGITDAIVNAGGDLRVIGQRGARPWRIGIRHPRGQGIIASIDLAPDESVYTSGDYERFFDYQGRRYHHIIDPRTGYPAQGVVSASIIHDSSAAADAASSALVVAGVEGWKSVAKAMGITQAMVIDDTGKIHMTPAMAKRLHFEVSPPPEVILSEAW